jgi:hypothetical protein
MRGIHWLTGTLAVGLIAAVGLLIAGEKPPEGQTSPSPFYLTDDIQYFPGNADIRPSLRTPPRPQLPERAKQGIDAELCRAALGDVLFTNVVAVHFVGPALPANPDGTLGGLGADDGITITIYEHYIAREAASHEGTVHRTLYAYDKLGKIEQRLPRSQGEAAK